jgi:hypothetical protein
VRSTRCTRDCSQSFIGAPAFRYFGLSRVPSGSSGRNLLIAVSVQPRTFNSGTVSLGSYFAGGVETEEQLDAALYGVREECARLIGAGKKVIVQ